MSNWIKQPFNIIGLIMILVGLAGVLGVKGVHMNDITAGGAGFQYAGTGSYIVLAIGCLLCDNPLSEWIFKRKPPEPPTPPAGPEVKS
jgi:hypothetical protein